MAYDAAKRLASRASPGTKSWSRALVLAVAAFLLAAAPAQESEIDPGRERQLFSQVDEMLAAVSKITGLEARKPINRELITREGIRKLVQSRLNEETTEEEIRLEELFLKKFGFVDPDFDLAGQMVDVLAEQATALYDFKTKKLYLATWTPADMQEFALVHELVHALQDQHFNLGKYIDGAKGADADLARMAVVEGQASWVMTEYVMRQGGRSLLTSRFLAVAAAAASRVEAKEFPVFASTPLFMQETLLFPYTWGLLFQQSVLEERGEAAFGEVFRHPPASSQHILVPEVYFEGRKPAKPELPKAKLGRPYKKVTEGEIGQLEHSILIRKFISEEDAKELAPKWRGARYALFEPNSKERTVLVYAVEWESAADAARYFDFYKQILGKKLNAARFETESANEAAGRSEDGGFIVTHQGAIVTGVEGLPDGKLK